MESQLFKITQNVVMKSISGTVLILCHATGKWLLPGGKIKKGETWFEGLQRELQEELYVRDFRISKILDVDTWIEGSKGYCVITYLIESSKEFPIKLSDEHKEFVWARPEDLKSYDFWNPKIKERIKKAFQ